MSETESETPGAATATIGFLGALGALFLRIVSLFFVIISWIGIVFQSLPFLLITALLTAVAIPWLSYHDVLIEEAEFGLRTKVYPVWVDVVRPFVNTLRAIFNPLICWWNAINWWVFGLFQEAIYPTLRDCGVKQVFFNLGNFIFAFSRDFIGGYLANGDFLIRPMDTAWGPIYNAWQTFWYSWQFMWGCACGDLYQLLRKQIFFIPYLGPNFYVFLIGDQIGDIQWLLFLGNLVDAIFALIRLFVDLVINILLVIYHPPGPEPFPRPDFGETFDFLCRSIEGFMRSEENAIQGLWDCYMPFLFTWRETFCAIDQAACIILRSAALLLRVFINIDRCVAYPIDLYWENVIKQDTIDIFNMWAPPTDFETVQVKGTVFQHNVPVYTIRFNISSYFRSTTSQVGFNGTANFMFGRKRLSDCICIFITRVLCDPRDNGTACFDTGATELLQGLDFCCIFTESIILAMDLFSGFFEWTLYVAKGSETFVLFVDEQPFTTVLKNDVVKIVDCLLQIFNLIPVVGHCIRLVIVMLAKWLLCLVDFLFRVLTGLFTLPFFVDLMPSTPNFLSRTDEALDFFVNINNELIAQRNDSFLTCLCVIINNGFPVPPIPCPTCRVTVDGNRTQDEYPPGDFRIRAGWGPTDMLEHVTGQRISSYLKVHPILDYGPGSRHTWNPFLIGPKILKNIQNLPLKFPDLKSVDRFIDGTQERLYERWAHEKECSALESQYYKDRGANKRQWYLNYREGKYDRLKDGSCEYSEADVDWDHDNYERLTLAPTVPPLTNCTGPGGEGPSCFDLCCAFRTIFEWFIHVLNFTARFYNGLVQYEASRYQNLGGNITQDFPYFTGEFCDLEPPRPCFESDVSDFIILLFRPIKCVCELINLVIPITSNGRQDICCAIQRIAELLACIFQVIFNSIEAFIQGGDFPYFTENLFYEDVNTLFDITLAVVECICVLIRGVFPLEFIPGFQEATGFDICCFPEAVLTTAVEIGRLVLQLILSLALINVSDESFCYFRLDKPNCIETNPDGILDDIGIVVQWDVIIDSFLTVRSDGACSQNCDGVDQGEGGVVPCICQIFNMLLPVRQDPSKAVSCNATTLNCPIVDFCCPFTKLSIAANDWAKFLGRATVALWQSWVPGYPEFWTAFIFCDETVEPYPAVPKCVEPSTVLPCGTFTCGKLNPFIDALVGPNEGLLARCTCEYLQLIDVLLWDAFYGISAGARPWGDCFCGQNPLRPLIGQTFETAGVSQLGILPAITNVGRAVLITLVNFMRQFTNLNYWQPCDPTMGCVLDSVEETWIFNFLGPVSDALCATGASIICFVNSFFFIDPICLPAGREFLGGLFRWAFEIVFRVVAFVEGFITQLVDIGQANNECLGGNCAPGDDSMLPQYNGIESTALGEIISALFKLPVDLLIGDSQVACTQVCPVETEGGCLCWNLSPNFPGTATKQAYYNSSGQCIFNTTFAPDYPSAPSPLPHCESIENFGMESVCVTRVACRPDSLPECGNHPDTPPIIKSESPFGSIDGILVGFLRYLACSLGPVGVIFEPLIILFSILWQIWAGVARWLSAIIVFVLSLFELEGGCDCHNYVSSSGNDTFIVEHVQVGALCYPCFDPNVPCTAPDYICPTYCPVNSVGMPIPNDAVGAAILNDFSIAVELQACVYQQGLDRAVFDPAKYAALGWPPVDLLQLATPADGTNPVRNDVRDRCRYPEVIIPDAAALIAGGFDQWCGSPQCSAGGTGFIPGGQCSGCSFPSDPKVLCSFLLVIQRFLDIFTTFFAIFTQPILIPGDLENRRMVGPVRRESIQNFKHRVRNFKGEMNIVEITLQSLYDFDVSDCFDDPVACVCRNMHVEQHCTWYENGLEYTHGTLTTAEITQIVSDAFQEQTVCDHVAHLYGGTLWEQIPSADKAQFVDCLEQRIRGERIHSFIPEFPVDFFYKMDSPMTLVHNVVQAAHKRMESSHERVVQRMETRASAFRKNQKRFGERLRERAAFARKALRRNGVEDSSMIFEAIIKADQLWFKLRSGYYTYLVNQAKKRILHDGIVISSTKEAWENLITQSYDVGRVIYHQPYRELFETSWTSAETTIELARDVWSAGPITYIQNVRYNGQHNYYHYGGGRQREIREKTIYNRLVSSPLVKWWNGPESGKRMFGDFRDHMSRVIAFQRTYWKMVQPSFFNADLAIRSWFSNLWPTPRWTDKNNEEYHKLKRLGYKIYDNIYPGQLSRDIYERFIFDCNCTLADETLRVTIDTFGYCATEFMPNLNFTIESRLEKFINDTEPYRKTAFYRTERRKVISHPKPADPDAWIRPRINATRKVPHGRLPKMNRNIYRRATTGPVPPYGFNLFDWLVCRLEEIFDGDWSQDLDNFIEDLKIWFENPNSDVDDYPDVGFIYWAEFWFKCEFPENLNCSIGQGLEESLGWIIIGSLIIFVALPIFFPPSLLPLIGPTAFLFYVIVVPAAAWHYSPRCWLMTPSFPIGSGISIPILPIPVAFPALPECFMDEFVALADKYITDCYDFIIPPEMVNGPVCPTDGSKIDFVNCGEVGIGDGISNLLFLFYNWGGQGFADVVLMISNTCLGMLWPGLGEYMQGILDGFRDASDTQRQRQEICFWLTIPSIALPLAFGFIFFLAIGLLVPVLIDILVALILVFWASPLSLVVPGNDQEWIDVGVEPRREEEEEVNPPDLPRGLTSMESLISRMVFGKMKKE